MVKCKYEGTGIWNGRCTGTKEVDPCLGYDKCKQYKPNYMTNADRIRAMSDEELAEEIYKGSSSDICDYCKGSNLPCNGVHCEGKTDAEIILEWLQQLAE